MLWSGGRPVVIDGCDSRRLGSKEDLKMLVKHSSREYRSVQGLDQVPGVL